MQTKITCKACENAKINGFKVKSIYIVRHSHPRKSDIESHYEIRAYLITDDGVKQSCFSHVSASKIHMLIEGRSGHLPEIYLE